MQVPRAKSMRSGTDCNELYENGSLRYITKKKLKGLSVILTDPLLKRALANFPKGTIKPLSYKYFGRMSLFSLENCSIRLAIYSIVSVARIPHPLFIKNHVILEIYPCLLFVCKS